MQNEPRVGCGAAIVIEGRILLLQRGTAPEAGSWGLPGGKIDLFETAQHATAREIYEELNLEIEPADLLCMVDQIDAQGGTHWVAPVYLVTRFTGELRNCEPHKHPAIDWFALDALPARLTTPTIQALAALRQRQR